MFRKHSSSLRVSLINSFSSSNGSSIAIDLCSVFVAWSNTCVAVIVYLLLCGSYCLLISNPLRLRASHSQYLCLCHQFCLLAAFFDLILCFVLLVAQRVCIHHLAIVFQNVFSFNFNLFS
eukprot:27570_1